MSRVMCQTIGTTEPGAFAVVGTRDDLSEQLPRRQRLSPTGVFAAHRATSQSKVTE